MILKMLEIIKCSKMCHFRNALKEKNNLVDELKEIVNENKESNYEFTSIISHQRQDIESLRKLLEDNNIEVNI